jgi:hypothetical protein
MIIKKLFTAAIIICVTLQAKTQTNLPDSIAADKKQVIKSHQLNFVKLNLTALPLKTYSIQYERVLNRKISFAASFRTMPSTTIPFKKQILNIVGDDEDAKKVIETVRLQNFAITPEFRFYVGKKGYGRGFYIAPFYRYAKYESTQLIFTYENSASIESEIKLSGNLTSNTGGIMFGAQWPLGKRLCIDWWIFGPHYGTGKGDFSGIASKPLTDYEQNDLRMELEELEIPLTEKTVIVSANGASMLLDGPWGGIRAGLSLGFKF